MTQKKTKLPIFIVIYLCIIVNLLSFPLTILIKKVKYTVECDFMKKFSLSVLNIVMLLITAFFISFAFIHSSMPGDVSGEESESVLQFLQNIINSFGIDKELSSYIVRKTAHFLEYAAIGGSLVGCAFSFNKTKPYIYSINILFTGLLTAVIDETIQLNVPGRSGQVSDVLIDFSGCITGTIFVMAVIKLIQIIINQKRKAKSN